jgi:hypothetical protein
VSTRLFDPSSGTFRDVPDELVEGAIAGGLKLPSQEQAAQFETSPAPDTSIAAKVQAGIGEGLSTATGGASDWLIGQLGTAGERRYHEQARRSNPGSTLIGAAIGAVTDPFGAGAAAARAGELAARGIKGEGALAAIARAGVSTGVEGVAQGAGTGVSELSLSDDDVSIEGAAGTLTSHMLFGGAIGAAAGTIGKSAERGLLRAKSSLDAVRARAVASGADEFAGKTAAELETLHTDEVKRLVEEQGATKVSSIQDLGSYRSAIREANPYLVVSDEGSAQLAKADAVFRKALDAPRALSKNPARLAPELERQERALEKALNNRDELLAAFEKQNASIAEGVTKQIAGLAPDAAELELTGAAMKRYANFADVKVTRGQKALNVPREAALEFVQAINTGAAKGSAEKAFGKLETLLDQNRALQAKLESTTIGKADLASSRLDAIAAAKAAADEAAKRQPGMIEQIAQGSIFHSISSTIGGALGGVPGMIVGAKVARAATDLVFGRLGKAAAESAARTSKAIDTFLSVAKGPARVVPPLASRVLSRVAYGPREHEGDGSLPALYNARSKEIRSQTEYGPDGKAMMRPAARAEMAKNLAGVRAASPILADKLETLAARRLEFLANVLPRRPDIGGIPLGPDRWQPSELDMRQFARYAAAVEDPAAIVERLASGNITPEDSKALAAVYPETMAAVRARIVQKLPELRQTLPYSKRVALSIFSGVPVDPAMKPEILGVLQGQFDEEPGTEGGTQAPKASPAFGSISKEKPTQAQERLA